LAGISLIASVLLAVSEGSIAGSIWLTLRILGLLTLVIAWIGIAYENAKRCIDKQEPVTLTEAGVFSILLGASYISVTSIDTWSIDTVRWSLFSSITFLLLLYC
jgi:hypothetical protein